MSSPGGGTCIARRPSAMWARGPGLPPSARWRYCGGGGLNQRLAGGQMRPSFSMTIRADPGQIARVRGAFAEFADAHAVPAPIRRSVSVALDELLNNTIVHGFAGRGGEGGGGGGAVSIDVELHSDRLCVTLTDDGKPFNPLEITAPDTALPVEERQGGGLGIHLARRRMDDVAYHRRADRSVVSLTKLLASGGGGETLDI